MFRKSYLLFLIFFSFLLFSQSILDKNNSKNLYLIKIDNQYGFINKEGKIIIAPQYDNADGFNGRDFAPVMINNKWGFIDKTGKIIIKPKYDEALSSFFENDLTPVKINNKWGYIDKFDKMIIKPQFDNASGFYGKYLAEVNILKKDDSSFQKNYGFINKKGEFIIKPQFEETFGFDESELAPVKINGKWGYIDKISNLVISPIFDYALGFYESNLAPVKLNEKWGYINKTGKIVIPIIYESAGYFDKNNELAPVKINELWGFIDTNGKIIIKNQFEKVTFQGFSSTELAPVLIGGKWGYIDKKGKIVIIPQYESAESFDENGIASVVIANSTCFINKNNQLIWVEKKELAKVIIPETKDEHNKDLLADNKFDETVVNEFFGIKLNTSYKDALSILKKNGISYLELPEKIIAYNNIEAPPSYFRPKRTSLSINKNLVYKEFVLTFKNNNLINLSIYIRYNQKSYKNIYSKINNYEEIKKYELKENIQDNTKKWGNDKTSIELIKSRQEIILTYYLNNFPFSELSIDATAFDISIGVEFSWFLGSIMTDNYFSALLVGQTFQLGTSVGLTYYPSLYFGIGFLYNFGVGINLKYGDGTNAIDLINDLRIVNKFGKINNQSNILLEYGLIIDNKFMFNDPFSVIIYANGDDNEIGKHDYYSYTLLGVANAIGMENKLNSNLILDFLVTGECRLGKHTVVNYYYDTIRADKYYAFDFYLGAEIRIKFFYLKGFPKK